MLQFCLPYALMFCILIQIVLLYGVPKQWWSLKVETWNWKDKEGGRRQQLLLSLPSLFLFILCFCFFLSILCSNMYFYLHNFFLIYIFLNFSMFVMFIAWELFSFILCTFLFKFRSSVVSFWTHFPPHNNDSVHSHVHKSFVSKIFLLSLKNENITSVIFSDYIIQEIFEMLYCLPN